MITTSTVFKQLRPQTSRFIRLLAHASSPQKETYLITTPLFYVNAAPHMGSAYPTIAADVIARFQRMKGRDVCFLTGTDEHGEKIMTAAKTRGKNPKQHCDEMVLLYKQLWNQLEIQYDRFVRTSEEEHGRFVREVVERVWEKGDIYLDTYEGYYCVDCEEYKDAEQMDDRKNCLIHLKPCDYRKEVSKTNFLCIG